MSTSLQKAASSRSQTRATSAFGPAVGRVRGREEIGTAKPRPSRNTKSKKAAGNQSAQAGSLAPGQVDDVIIVTAAATFSERLAACLEDAENEEACNTLFSTCNKSLNTIQPLTSLQSFQASTEGHGWQAVNVLSAKLKATLETLPDGDELLEQIRDPLKPASGYADCAQFVNGAHHASRIRFWEMIADHVETIDDALQDCLLSI